MWGGKGGLHSIQEKGARRGALDSHRLPIAERRGAKVREALGDVRRGQISRYAHSYSVMLEVDYLSLPPPGPLALSTTRSALVVLENVGLGGEFAVASSLMHEGVDELDILNEVRP